MTAQIAPTITASNPHTYREQMERIAGFAKRVHIDFADGIFAPTKMVQPEQAWWPDGIAVDVHAMIEKPGDTLAQLISMRPNLIILHAEAAGDIIGYIREINGAGIQSGIAILENSQPEAYALEIEEAEHVLIFGGNLGYHGGDANLDMLKKIDRIKQINPHAELGWDGGANAANTPQIVKAGINVVNVGSFIHKSDAPQDAYAILEQIVH